MCGTNGGGGGMSRGGYQPHGFTGSPGTGANMGAMPVKSLGMPGGTAGATGYGGMDQNGYSGNPYGTGGLQPAVGAGGASDILYPSSAMGRPTNDNPNPQSLGNGIGGAWDPRSSGANTGFQGTPSAGDIYNGKWGFQAGMSGPEKQQWLQNNAAPLTGHNYMPDLSAHQADVQARLGANRDAVMSKMQANPAYALMQAGGAGTGGDAASNHTGYANNPLNAANKPANAGLLRMQAAGAYQNSLTPEMIQQQVNNGQRSAGTAQQMQAMLANMSPQARADYIAKMQGVGIDPTYSGPVGSGIFGNGR